MANGTYTVRLHFSEPTFNAKGKRVLDVNAEGVTRISNLDIYASAGAMNRGVLREFPVTVSDGAMTLQFLGKKNQNAVVSGLEIVAP